MIFQRLNDIRLKNSNAFCADGDCVTLDAVLAFCMGYIMYLLLDYAALSGATRSGISCVVILFSRTLYEWGNEFIKTKLSTLIAGKAGKNERE